MKVGIELRIDVSKIDKARLYKGQKGTYLTMTTFVDLDEKDQFDNNGFIAEKVSKEEQQHGVKGNILGNAKVFWSESNAQQVSNQPQQQPVNQMQRPAPQQQYQAPQGFTNQVPVDNWDDSIPF